MVERIDAARDLGEPHCLAMTRVGVGGIAGLGTDDLLEDQDVARLETQDAVAAGRLAAARRCRCGSRSQDLPLQDGVPAGGLSVGGLSGGGVWRGSHGSTSVAAWRLSAGSIRNRPTL